MTGRNSVTYWTLFVVVLFLASERCLSVAPQLYSNVDASRSCEVSNLNFWKLINWFFERTTYVVISTISGTNLTKSDTATTFIRELSKNAKFTILIKPRDWDFEDDTITFADTYTWRGTKFAPRADEPHFRSKRQAGTSASASVPVRSTYKRKDEPETGTMVVVENLNVLDNYLMGTARRPFRAPRRYYIIVLRRVDEGWMNLAGIVMARLWKDYGIINAIILAPCADSGEEMVGTYEPFSLKETLSVTNASSKEYGHCSWTALHNLQYGDNILNKLASLNGFPLKVSIFQRYPTALLAEDLPNSFLTSYFSDVMKLTNGINGFDGLILGNMAKALNFRVDVIKPIGSDFGYKADNGTFIGSLGDVLYRRVYASFNGRFVADYGTNDIEGMYPVFFDKFCIIAPKSLRIPEWMAIFKCFDMTVWSLIIIVNVLCGYFWYILKQWVTLKSSRNLLNRKAFQNESKIYGKCTVTSIEMWIIMMGASTHMPYRTIERFFIAACLVANVIISGSFQGSLTTSYSTTTYYADIDTLEQLDKSGLHIGTSSESLKDILGDGGTTTLRSLISKFSVFSSGMPIIDRAAFHRDICAIERQADINVIIAKRYELADGTVQLHAIKECPKTTQITYIVKKGWPFLPVFNNIIQRFNEGGLLVKWYQMVEHAIIFHERLKRRNHNENLRVFTLVDVQTAFYILGIGLFFCITVFVLEVCLDYRDRNIQSAFDCKMKLHTNKLERV